MMGCSHSTEEKKFIQSQARANMQHYMLSNMYNHNLRPSQEELTRMTSSIPSKLRKKIQKITLKEINKAQLRNAVLHSPKV